MKRSVSKCNAKARTRGRKRSSGSSFALEPGVVANSLFRKLRLASRRLELRNNAVSMYKQHDTKSMVQLAIENALTSRFKRLRMLRLLRSPVRSSSPLLCTALWVSAHCMQSLHVRMTSARPYEIVVWGATGSVGKLVCEHVAQNYQVRVITDKSRSCFICVTGRLYATLPSPMWFTSCPHRHLLCNYTDSGT